MKNEIFLIVFLAVCCFACGFHVGFNAGRYMAGTRIMSAEKASPEAGPPTR
jgi:hypothetical protein